MNPNYKAPLELEEKGGLMELELGQLTQHPHAFLERHLP